MENCLNINGYLSYITNYYESFTEFLVVNNILNNQSDYVNTLCFNIRSAKKNFNELALFLEIDKNRNKIDVIVLTETWHDPCNCKYVIDGYNLYFSMIKRNQNDGIIVFVKQNLNVDFFEYDCPEANIAKLSIKTFSKQIYIFCMYRSPSAVVDNFNDTLKIILRENKLINNHTVLIGDMNINIIGDNLLNNAYFDLLSEYGFASLINVCTRLPNGQNQSCLDHIFVRNNELLSASVNAGVLQSDINDHFSTCVSIPITTLATTKTKYISLIDDDKFKNVRKCLHLKMRMFPIPRFIKSFQIHLINLQFPKK